jgi:hypothetical protein
MNFNPIDMVMDAKHVNFRNAVDYLLTIQSRTLDTLIKSF